MNRQTLYHLIKKDKEGTATPEEQQALANWYNQVSEQEAAFPDDEQTVKNDILTGLLDHIDFPKTRKINYKRWLAAASVVLMLGAGALFLTRQHTDNLIAQKIVPGSNKAILVLANGSKIALNDAVNGQIAQQNGLRVSKSANGQLVYEVTGAMDQNTEPSYNTMETPRGGQYQLILADGTKVWLNAASSIKYPLNFTNAKERRVELNGEAYFEVAHNKALPFRVVTGKQVVEVLGTHFDVNAYTDEQDTKTTLLQGSVRITAGTKNALLKPGQEASLTDGFKVSDVDANMAIDWKNGYFRFDDVDLEAVMRQVARWYDVKVEYTDESVKKESLVAVSTRFAEISTLLKLISQATDTRFTIEGKTIKVGKK